MEDRVPLLKSSSQISHKGDSYHDYGGTEELERTAEWRSVPASDAGNVQNQVTVSFGKDEEEATPVSSNSLETLVRFFFVLKHYVLESHWPLSCFMSLAFLGFYLPQKRKSKWALTFLPFFLLLVGLGGHAYFIVTSSHRGVHVGTKMLLSSVWVSSCVTYALALYHFWHHSQSWTKELSKTQWRVVTLVFYLGIFVVSLVLICDGYYQVIFDLVNIKDALLSNCRQTYCKTVFYTVAVSVYWGMYAAVTVCCVFLAQCLCICNTLTKGYTQISRCTGDVREALRMHAKLRETVADNIRSIRTWFTVHLLFNILILLANVFVWWEAASIFTAAYEYVAQIAGTLVVVYKFFFPFISASCVTWHEYSLAQELNDRVDYVPEETFYSRLNLEVFLKQSKRRGYGFRLYKIQITFTIAIFSLLGSVSGLIYNMMKI